MKTFLFKVVAAAAVPLFLFSTVMAQTEEALDKDKILSASPEWLAKYDQYVPEADSLEVLRGKVGADLKIDVYVGLWCPDSRRNVPPFLKIMESLGKDVPVRYFGVPRKASRDIKYYVEKTKVERVPTFIFYRNGKEIGRIIENPRVGMIEDFLEIVSK